MPELRTPPRPVPLMLGLQCVFGGSLQKFGWGFFAVGMFLLLVFGAKVELPKVIAFQGSTAVVSGQVTGLEETGAEVNETEVVAYFFSYKVADQTFDGRSYTTGYVYNDGDSVQIEYSVSDPGLAKIVGTRMGTFSPWFLLLLGLLPGVGLALALTGFRSGLKGRSLLGKGVLGLGTLESKEPTNVSVNDQTVYKLTFTFQPEGSQRLYKVSAKTHTPENLEDEEQERILYDPRYPSNAVLLDSLPGGALIDDQGNLSQGSLISAASVLLLPGLAFASIIYTIFFLLSLATT